MPSLITHSRDVSSGCLVMLGGEGNGGTYVHRIRVSRRLHMTFGRFREGRVITVEPGEYLYVGSARSQSGSTCLARRLVRHASRSGDKPPHGIRGVLVTDFLLHGMYNCKPVPDQKRLKWNVDYLLDQDAVRLAAVYALRTRLNLEEHVGKWLEQDRATVAFEPGLGANDIPGNTHLLRVDAGEEWWTALPQKLAGFLRGGAAMRRLVERHGEEAVSAAWQAARPPARVFVTLSNMWHERAADVLARLRDGVAVTRAVKQSEGVYDTCNWGEVVSRLARARGSLVIVAEASASRQRERAPDDVYRRFAADHAERILASVSLCLKHLDRITGRERPKRIPAARSDAEARRCRRVQLSAARGHLRRCLIFVAKNGRDLPLIVRKTGLRPSPGQADAIRTELSRIKATAEHLRRLASGGR